MRTLFLLILLTACSKPINVIQKRGIDYLEDFELGMKSPKELEWNVGVNREKTLSQGFFFEIEVPKINKDHAKILMKKHGVDSWVYRISRIRNGYHKPLGFILLPFNRIKKATDEFSVHIYYTAAAASRRFRRFHCPAFNHRKKMKNLSLENKDREISRMVVLANENLYSNMMTLDHYPIIINGESSLVGDYVVEIALYNQSQKQLFSKFYPLSNSINIAQEEEVAITSCNGIKEEVTPLQKSRELRIQDLEIH